MAVPQFHPLYGDWPLTPFDLPSSAEMDRLFRGSEQAVFDSAFAPGAGVPPAAMPARNAATEEGDIFWDSLR